MRAYVIVLAMLIVTIPLVPGSDAEATPVLIWPSPEFMDQEQAANLTAWFAERLGLPTDPSEPGRWQPFNGSGPPDFLVAKTHYVLPVPDGQIVSRYTETGVLKEIWFEGNTSYVAESEEEADLMAVASQIASSLELDTSQSIGGLEIIILHPGTTQEEIRWRVRLEEHTDLGRSFLFNDLSVDVRGSDLRVMFVGLCVWYRQSGNPEVSASDAVGIALGIARSEHNATDPSGLTLTVAVRNGESFVYNVYVHWSGECSMDWTLEVWVDATTGEVLAQEGPQEVCVYTADPSGLLLFLFGLIVVIVTVVAVVIVEARVRKKKAKR